MARVLWIGCLVGSLWALGFNPQFASAQDAPVVESPAAEPAAGETTEGTVKSAAADHKHDSDEPADHADGHDSHAAGGHDGHEDLGKKLPIWSAIFFVAILLCIAVLPLVHGHWWEHNENKAKVAGALALPVVLILVGMYGSAGFHVIQHVLLEYVSFIMLLTALYVISGGIYVKGSLSGTPLANTSLMAIGAAIASIVGTTGASVLLIRPLLRANKTRVNKVHIVVFFIFIVSNCGGLLTPLGDPPLFLGFLKGVPFEWTLINLWPHWLVMNIGLLVIFHIWDEIVFNREERERPGSQLEEVMEHEPVRILGGLNFLFLAGVVAVIVLTGLKVFHFGGEHEVPFVKELLMGGLALAAYFTTAPANRTANNFTFAPIIEVAVLFVGIFITMAPAIQILNARGAEIPITDNWQYFWATGILSSFLDNAPTYLTFAATASGKMSPPIPADQLEVFLQAPGGPGILAAISCAAVFMGANTYIGNGPNFMVKAIAEENGVKMPSFFGYMFYSGVVLVPLLLGITFLFFLK